MAQQRKSVCKIIDDYKRTWLSGIKRELSECKEERDYVYGKRERKDGIQYIYTSPNSHQKRLYGNLDEVVDALTQANLHTLRFETFEDLYDAVKKIYESNGHPNAILAIYDTALRIGYNSSPQILPEKFVYLYGTSKTGPLGGATRLYGQGWIDKHFDKINHRIATKWFMNKFPNLPSWEIESILCIYANCFYLNMPY